MAFDAEAEKLAEHIREEVAKIEDEEAIEMLYVNKDKDK
jgi:ABC-type sugar transport system ATPase subunit